MTTDKQETYAEERRRKRNTLAGWALFFLALIATALVLAGPCDPAPEPIPAGAPATTTGAVEGSPGESSSSSGSSTTTAGETSTGSTGVL